MRIADLKGKNVCILGYGKEGKAVEQALKIHAPTAHMTIRDKKDNPAYLKDLESFDVIIKSPGIPPQPEFEAVKEKMTSSTQIFLDSVAGKGVVVIGVTGSKGKSTTSTLIYEILKAGAKAVSLIGNIGEPAISHLEEAKSGKVFVMEMSSYQLMDLTVSPQIAVITSFFPEHLDYHASAPLSTGSTPLERYKNAKKNIARFQKKPDVIFYCATSDGAREIAMESAGERIPFSADESPVSIEETHLLGEHNRSNIAAAWKVGEHIGISVNTMMGVIRNFRGLPHRLQSLGVHHEIEWIDDAISTTPESAIAALDALGDRVATIILGGQDRGNDFAELAKRIKKSKVKTVILFPGTGPRIREAIGDTHADVCFHDADSMEKAVEFAKKNTMTGKICLLSTASPSYNMFTNFEEKGDAFKKCVTGV